jgi:hypothetical protein
MVKKARIREICRWTPGRPQHPLLLSRVHKYKEISFSLISEGYRWPE